MKQDLVQFAGLVLLLLVLFLVTSYTLGNPAR